MALGNLRAGRHDDHQGQGSRDVGEWIRKSTRAVSAQCRSSKTSTAGPSRPSDVRIARPRREELLLSGARRIGQQADQRCEAHVNHVRICGSGSVIAASSLAADRRLIVGLEDAGLRL